MSKICSDADLPEDGAPKRQNSKEILEDPVMIKNKIEKSQQLGVWSSDTVPRPLMHKNDWRAGAYKEVSSFRKEHSYLLDKAYTCAYTKYHKYEEVASNVYRHMKCVNFLASSNTELYLLSRRKYSKWMEECETILSCMRQPVVSQSQPVTLTHPTQESCWRDEFYDEIRSFRKKYSYWLDEAFRKVSEIPPQELDACYHFLWESLQFLTTSRADIALRDSKDDCYKQLGDIRRFVTNDESFAPTLEYKKILGSTRGQSSDQTRVNNNSTNWRDVAYDQLQYKVTRFTYHVYDVYMRYRKRWSKMEECHEDLEDLEACLQGAFRLYEMPRSEMSVFKSMDDYFELVRSVDGYVLGCALLIEHLRRALRGQQPRPFLDHGLLMPKRKKVERALASADGYFGFY